MNVRHLVDGIVQQTTVLIAQLSTAAGIRAPLARVADQVFYDLAREIERQGVGRKVVADMFGLALRTYQKKVQRLSESVSVRDRTLWEAVLEHVRERGPVSRRAIAERFKRDPIRDVAAVLNDLTSTGLVYVTGRGDGALYGVTSDAERAALAAADDDEAASHLVWLAIYKKRKVALAALATELRLDEKVVRDAAHALATDGRIAQSTEDGADWLAATELRIPVGAEQGWETAVFDHYQAMCAAIAAKLGRGETRSEEGDVFGGATLRFDVHPAHPHAPAVYGLLRRVRTEVNALWEEVQRHNREHPLPADGATRVSFYFGQSIEDTGDDETRIRKEET
jgi:hypothetical protein